MGLIIMLDAEGLTFSLSVPIGWAAMTGRFDWHVIAPCVIAYTWCDNL